jgi:hypothetical protein
MSPLNIHPEEDVAVPKKKKKQNKTLKVMLGIAALVAVPVVGTTLAASIAVNAGGNVDFGQGAATAAACDSALTISATSAYASSTFQVKTISVSGIDLKTTGGSDNSGGSCLGKTLIVSADVSGTEGAISGTDTQISFTLPSSTGNAATMVAPASGVTAVLYKGATGTTTYASGGGDLDEAGRVLITIATPVLTSSTVTKFLVQSS